MDYILRDADERELNAMMKFSEEMFIDRQKEKEHQKILNQECNPHDWLIVNRKKNTMIRVCQTCEKEKHNGWTNDQLNYIERHLVDFAQPGTKLYDQAYGQKKA